MMNIAGDFAVLLRSGMTVKQAVMYNMVSSVLAFTGMCLGIVLGTLHWTASSWVFALTAGIFIYVSLVDMVSHSDGDLFAKVGVSLLPFPPYPLSSLPSFPPPTFSFRRGPTPKSS